MDQNVKKKMTEDTILLCPQVNASDGVVSILKENPGDHITEIDPYPVKKLSSDVKIDELVKDDSFVGHIKHTLQVHKGNHTVG